MNAVLQSPISTPPQRDEMLGSMQLLKPRRAGDVASALIDRLLAVTWLDWNGGVPWRIRPAHELPQLRYRKDPRQAAPRGAIAMGEPRGVRAGQVGVAGVAGVGAWQAKQAWQAWQAVSAGNTNGCPERRLLH